MWTVGQALPCAGVRKELVHWGGSQMTSEGSRGLSCQIIQFSRSVMSTLCDPMNRSMPGLPVYHQLPEFTQTHVHRVGDAIQPSYPLSSPSPPALNFSQHLGLFK